MSELYPSLQGAKEIAIDCETNDPNLSAMGAGDIRGDGHVAGISISTGDFTQYYPIGHEGGGNLPRDVVIRYLRRELATSIPKVGARFGYDLGWLHSLGITCGGVKRDVQIAEALIDEDLDEYTLDSLCLRYLGKGKDEELLRQECAKRGWKTDNQVKSNLWKLPAQMVAPYAAFDALGTLQVYQKQKAELDKQELWQVFDLESKLTDVLHRVRLRGIPISYERGEEVIAQLNKEENKAQEELDKIAGKPVDVWSAKQLADVFSSLGYGFPTTEKGNPSFTGDWLKSNSNELTDRISLIRTLDRSGNVFVRNKILGYAVNGRIHPNFAQTKRDDYGTRSGRFSSYAPNMQQVPSRHPIMAPLIRSVFVPDKDKLFGVFDYSQQEPRVTLHYACLREYKGAKEALEKYIENPRVDYHQLVADMAKAITGVDIGRKVAKTLNLGMAYGMGINKLSSEIGLTPTQSEPVFKAYHAAVPYVRLLGDEASRIAKKRGYVKTLLGRRRHFQNGKFAHKALNAVIQGGSADMMKQAMVNLDDAGFEIYNTVHDEINLPISYVEKDGKAIANKKEILSIEEIMNTSVNIVVPLVVDVEIGKNWGDVSPWQKA
jgi:DNA polymerase I-like protein with 3'-5' exonuclease and polymerase domains